MGYRLSIVAAAVVVLGANQALADDSAAADRKGTVLIVGGAAQAPAANGIANDPSLWTDLRHLFADTTIAIGASPTDDSTPGGIGPGYSAYAEFEIAGFTIGSRFARWGEPTAPEVESQSFGVGASYSLDSWTVGIDWSRGDYDEIFLDVGSGEADDVIAFTSSYDLRPGVQINGLVEYSDEEPASSGSTDGAFTVGIGTLINF